jgi:membrane-associated phospholipid phosphatase
MLSVIFRPYYMPVVGFVALFTFTYLTVLPIQFKASILLMVYAFTVALPSLTIWVYRRLTGLAAHQMGLRENRYVPYILFIASYAACLHVMWTLHLPRYMSGIIVSALLTQVACFLINLRWNISTHAAGAGGVTGALMAYSILFTFNPIWWLCLSILLMGVVGSARMLFRRHTLEQVLAGALIGGTCAFCGILLI